ncbi:hypothetical protein R3X27_06520 [Tropicimonas sp. TH_r6]|uniref:hypothetical protein n=1 Tax=Tropicimonas sp. TH_r6 TaxID=3082085 RepID=UPI002953E406|nr:hypothetical protein [Tropicimonas sp. TH_r6]MDV7142331.1 hypothetical protein [Tropicimonas sp. TH_r6]
MSGKQEPIWNNLINIGSKNVASQKVRSVLTPTLWLCGLISAPTLTLYGYLGKSVDTVMVLASIPLVIAAYQLIFFTHRNPGLLQSEQFQLARMQIDLVGQSGSDNVILAEYADFSEDPTDGEDDGK